MEKKPFLLMVVVALIVLAILYIQSSKPHSNNSFVQPTLGRSSNGNYPSAPEFSGVSQYINSNSSLTLSSLKGKVVLVDFWTYSCINCIRTLPYLKAWNEKYADKGLVIVGVHTPEFDFEKDPANVRAAVNKFNITYPVLMDNDYSIWNSYSNQYWPHEFLIDANGKVRYDQIGEGGEVQLEQEIQSLLSEANNSNSSLGSLASSNMSSQGDLSQISTPEIYLGYRFARSPLGNVEGFSPENIVYYNFSGQPVPNQVYLNGNWKNNLDNMELTDNSGLVTLYYKAGKVHIVAGSLSRSNLSISIDGKSINSTKIGSDADENSIVEVTNQRLYTLVDSDDYSPHKITFNVSGSGFRLYTFTFG